MIIEKDKLIEGQHGKPIAIDFFYNNSGTKKPVVIFSHGFKGFKDWGPFNVVAKEFAKHNFVFIKLNFAFNGTTPLTPQDFTDLEAFGNNNFSKELDDLNTLLNFLEKEKASDHNFDLENISLIGHSRGGGISILKGSTDKRIKKIVLWNSVNEFGKYLTVKQIEEWKENGVIYLPNLRTGQQMPLYIQLYNDTQNKHDYLNIKIAVENLNKPLLIIHGKDDETVDVVDAIEMQRWNRKAELVLLENANHTFNAEHPYLSENLTPEFSEAVVASVSFLKK
ncbi:MAG TPA: alpha/beta hydrolase [Bacteroidia bacterium]|nr:alpha/beta hydrolase [Bacteroidia bacterium]HNU33301.1 alpha/beta hydrolase [Bacteroidia bacterium]